MATTYLSVVHLATAGLNGPQLGSDEEEIVFICLVVVNMQTNQVNNSTNIHIFSLFLNVKRLDFVYYEKLHLIRKKLGGLV